MDFDTNALERLLSQPDDRLWQTICKIAAINGITLPQSAPPKEEMEKLRVLLSGAEGASYEEALKTIASYKRKR